MHPYFVSQFASEHIHDLQTQTAAAHRASQVRRSRRARNSAAAGRRRPLAAARPRH